ncbi:uracil-DNA glycosylase family protein [Neisseriaceae bacterium ESL0693]|nr:uracil-DNA glycosylase family protein [Neisseriaceae bacterium ESL0693]
MLDSRYLYLHEALDLGPMWLLQQAKVVPAATPAPAAAQKPARQTLQPTPPETQPAAARVKTAVSAPSSQPTVNAPAIPPAVEAVLAAAAPVPAFTLVSLPDLLQNCQRCPLHQERSHPLSGHGNPEPRLMIISLSPSPEDDSQQQLFSGSSGLLLRNMLLALNLTDQDVFYTSQVKCTPNLSLKIKDEYQTACLPYLQQQIRLMQPQAILLLGQQFHKLDQTQLASQLNHCPYVIIPHPARLLSQSQLKAKAWQALQTLKQYLP